MHYDFTPGPWVIEEAFGTKREHCYWGILPVLEGYAYRGHIARASDAENIKGITKPEALANARLISAAPDLFHAVKDLLDAFHEDPLEADGSAAIERAYAAIAKATGEAE